MWIKYLLHKLADERVSQLVAHSCEVLAAGVQVVSDERHAVGQVAADGPDPGAVVARLLHQPVVFGHGHQRRFAQTVDVAHQQSDALGEQGVEQVLLVAQADIDARWTTLLQLGLEPACHLLAVLTRHQHGTYSTDLFFS